PGFDQSDLPGDLGLERRSPHHRLDYIHEVLEHPGVARYRSGPDQGQDLPGLCPLQVVAAEAFHRSGKWASPSFRSKLGIEEITLPVSPRFGENLPQIGGET